MARRAIRDLMRTALLGLAALIACAAPAATLRVAIPLEPPILDPTAGAAIAIDEVTYHSIFEGLTTLAADGSVHPLLAESWTISADGLRYDFHLRAGVLFHDGEPFDARAVAFSIARAIAPGSTNAQRDALSNIARVDVIDARDVCITLRTADADFLRLLSYGDAVIVPPRSADRLATDPIGTGPFRFAGWRRGSSLSLIRNAGYWGTPARLSAASFRFIADPNAAYAAMRAHDIDLFLDYPAPETLRALGRDRSLRVISAPSESEVILAFNQRLPALADIRIRRAIAMALDRRALIDGAMYGYGTSIGSHFPPQNPDYIDLTALSPHDPAAARALLAQAGHAHDLSFTLALPPSAYARRSGEIIAAQLRAIGITIAIRNLDWAQWLDQVLTRHDFDLTIVNHAEPFDYEIYGRPDYYFGYHSTRFDALLAALKRTADPAQRHALLQSVQRVLAEDAANGFLFQLPRLGVEDVRLRGAWANTPNAAIDLAQADFAGSVSEPPARTGAEPLFAICIGAFIGIILVWLTVVMGWRFLLRRAAVLLLMLLAASILIFALLQIVPGDPALTMMGPDASPAAVAALRTQLHLTGPTSARYLQWLGGMLRGDFGTSYAYRVPVGPILAERLALSLPLALLATLLSVLIGVPMGVWAAERRGSWIDRGLSGLARIGIAVPSFWLALLLVLAFTVKLGWFAAGGFPGWEAGIGAGLAALALPIVALGLPQAAILARVTRAAVLDQLGDEHLRAARARGVSRKAALWRHAVPNALGPVLTILGLQIPFLIAGAAIIEAIFFLPGLGRLAIQAIGQRDLIMVQGAAMLFVTITVVSSLAFDIAQAALDPRLRDAR